MDKKTLNFITKANNIHNNKYDYSLVNYTTSRNRKPRQMQQQSALPYAYS